MCRGRSRTGSGPRPPALEPSLRFDHPLLGAPAPAAGLAMSTPPRLPPGCGGVFSWYQSNATGEGFTRAVLGRYRSYLSDRGLSAASIILALAARRKLASAAASNGGRGGLRSVGYAEQCRLAIQKTEIWTTTATRAHCPVAPKKNGRIFFQHLENVSRRAAASGAWFDAGDWVRGA